MAEIVVIGSINMDIVTRTERFPEPGETIHANNTVFHPGGKGANQAVAAARLGADVAMVGAVGDDAFGRALRSELTSNDINISCVRCIADASTGIASITVDKAGRNTILVSSGANTRFSLEDAVVDERIWDNCQLVLLQNEILDETTYSAVRQCKAMGIRVVYNPAPMRTLHADMLQYVDVLVVNEIEASALAGEQVTDVESAVTSGRTLMESGCGSVIVTLGGSGCVFINREKALYVPAIPVDVVDTTAAGDTFIGAFAAASRSHATMEDVLSFATGAAALSVRRHGAQPSIPTLHEVRAVLIQHEVNIRVL